MATRYDAILIPGGGVREGGTLPPWVRNRFDYTVEIYRGEYILTLSAGTVHKPPPLNSKGFPIFESVAGAKYLVDKGINPTKILTETISYDTIGNAYFARMIHVGPMGFRNLLIITSEFHMQRTKEVFNWIFALDVSSDYFHLEFISVPNQGVDETTLVARSKREQENLKRIRDLITNIQSIQQLHEWLYSEHAAYAMALQPSVVSNDAIDTY